MYHYYYLLGWLFGVVKIIQMMTENMVEVRAIPLSKGKAHMRYLSLVKKSLYSMYRCAALQEKFGAPCCSPVSGL